MESNKRIVLSGYYGFDNTGDEAVLYSIIQALRKQENSSNISIVVLSHQPQKTEKLYNVEAVNRWDIKAVYHTIKNCDLLISGGGSLLQDVTSSKTIPYYLMIVKMAQWHKKKILFYSQGIGPVNRWYSRYLVKKVVSRVNHIFVRDEDSKKELQNIGVTGPPIDVAVDPVLGIMASESMRVKMKELIGSYTNKENQNEKEDKMRVGIYLRPWTNDSLLMNKMKVVCNILYNQGVDIFFIPMHQPEDRYFLEKMPSIDIPIYKITQELSVEEVVALTGQMDLVIGMRLHALIMAVAQGVPVVGLSYDPKVTAFMKMIDEKKCFDVERFEPEVIANCVLWQLQNIQRERISMEEKRKLLVQKVYEPAKMIQTMLGN